MCNMCIKPEISGSCQLPDMLWEAAVTRPSRISNVLFLSFSLTFDSTRMQSVTSTRFSQWSRFDWSPFLHLSTHSFRCTYASISLSLSFAHDQVSSSFISISLSLYIRISISMFSRHFVVVLVVIDYHSHHHHQQNSFSFSLIFKFILWKYNAQTLSMNWTLNYSILLHDDEQALTDDFLPATSVIFPTSKEKYPFANLYKNGWEKKNTPLREEDLQLFKIWATLSFCFFLHKGLFFRGDFCVGFLASERTECGSGMNVRRYERWISRSSSRIRIRNRPSFLACGLTCLVTNGRTKSSFGRRLKLRCERSWRYSQRSGKAGSWRR